jgi:hypothetical protein
VRLSETVVDKATVENVLNSASVEVIARTATVARSGVLLVGETLAKYSWNGMPLSRANDLRVVSGLER